MANQQVQQQQQRQLTPMQHFNQKINDVRMQEYLSSVLGERKGQFVTTLISVVANNAALQQCEPMSVVYAALKATSLGLAVDPNLGYAALIPYNNTKEKRVDCQFQVMKNGFVELAMRSGQVVSIVNEIVHEGELVRKNKFTGDYEFDEEKKTSEKVIGYMAYIRLVNGFEKTFYWSKEECEAHAKRYSQTYKKGYGQWADNFDAMALKTVLKLLLSKYAPKSIDMQNAILADQATIDKDGKLTYIDGPEDQEQPKTLEEAVDKQKEGMRERRADGGPTEGDQMP